MVLSSAGLYDMIYIEAFPALLLGTLIQYAYACTPPIIIAIAVQGTLY